MGTSVSPWYGGAGATCPPPGRTQPEGGGGRAYGWDFVSAGAGGDDPPPYSGSSGGGGGAGGGAGAYTRSLFSST